MLHTAMSPPKQISRQYSFRIKMVFAEPIFCLLPFEERSDAASKNIILIVSDRQPLVILRVL